MFYRILKVSETSYNIQKLDKDLRVIEVKEASKYDSVFKKFQELTNPEYNLFWYNSKGKLNWEVLNIG
jgi:hypothetical protein